VKLADKSLMILNATSEYGVVFLYLFWITTIFQTNISFETKNVFTRAPLERRARDNCPRFASSIRSC